MAFALTKFRAWGDRPAGPQPARGIQYVEVRASGTSSDVILDLGDFDGTFWAAADDSAVGAAALNILQNLIEPQVVNCVGIGGTALADRVQVASLTTTGQYLVDFADSDVPNISVNAADGETSWFILLSFQLADGIEPINCTLSA